MRQMAVRGRAARVLRFLGVVLLLAGTVPAQGDTRQDLAKIQRYIIDLQQQVWELQKRLDEQQAATQAALEGLKKQLEAYQATQTQVVQQMQVLLNEIQALKEQLRQTESYLRTRPAPGAPPTGPGNTTPAESPGGPPSTGEATKKPEAKPAPDLFQIAYADYSRGQYDVAVAEFRQFIEANPKDPRVPEARYWIGECHYAKKAYLDAIVDFDNFLREYADHRLAPAAYYKKALAYLQMGRKAQAASEFRNLIRLYPDSEEAQAARSQLKQLGVEP
ncbi:Cell division coordinator CpoB [bacterium HR11]|nr:Cell division coordinator CpoB [bacterium HR11]